MALKTERPWPKQNRKERKSFNVLSRKIVSFIFADLLFFRHCLRAISYLVSPTCLEIIACKRRIKILAPDVQVKTLSVTVRFNHGRV